jgi:methionine synthase I (cobalamin-dependent)
MLCTGEISGSQLGDVFSQQASALAEGGADGLVIETMGDLQEAKLAVAAAKSTGLPVVACMCFDSGADNDRTMMGVTPEQAAEELQAAGADVIGANCGQGIEGYIGIARRLSQATDLPIWIKANAGIPKLVDGEIIYETTPEQFASRAAELLEIGVSFIGGCCGTSPEFIQAIAKELAT